MKIVAQAVAGYFRYLGATAVRNWRDFWFLPADPATLALLRILTGLSLLYMYGCMTPEVLDYVGPTAYLDDTAIAQFSGATSGGDLHPWYGQSLWFYIRDPRTIMIFHGYFLAAIACFTLGLFSRVSNALVWMGHLSYLHRGFILWYGVDAMLSFLLICLLIGPTGKAWSLDLWLERFWRKPGALAETSEPRRYWTANFAIRAVQLHMCLVYLCSGLSKLQGESWWDGTAVIQICLLDNIAPFDLRWIGHLSDRTISLFSSLGVLVTLGYEIGFSFLIWNRTLRPLVLTCGVLLHAGIGMVMGLGLFSFVMLIGCAAFIRPAALRWLLAALRGGAGLPNAATATATALLVWLPQFALAADSPAAADNKALPRRLALLVGCTKYVNSNQVQELWGPANDVPLIARLLTDSNHGFGFAAENVRQLLGWPDDEKARPSYANIVAAFEQLIERVTPESQVFILMSGHGAQVPIPPSQASAFDPQNYEPDGLDEVFLPADVKSWGPHGLDNAIKDDQFGGWLDRLRTKGAHVWITFDCCHSGTMSRGVEMAERYRAVRAQDLKIPESALAQAAAKSQAGAQPRSNPATNTASLDIASRKDATGSVVAFYAAQSWELAPELPRPGDAAQSREHYYGLLSYTLAQCLEQRNTPVSYRGFKDLLLNAYRADRGARPPTPFFEGDLDRELLGLRVWPEQQTLTLTKDGGRLRVNAGELRGLALGTVLAVFSQAAGPLPTKTILGYVKVASVNPVFAQVEPCAHDNVSAVSTETFPPLARCEIVAHDLGDLRLKLGVLPDEANKSIDELSMALSQLPADVQRMIKQTPPGDAHWLLGRLSPEQARRQFKLNLAEPKVTLFDAATAARLGFQATTNAKGSNDPLLAPKICGLYAASRQEIVQGLTYDLPKIFAWQNVWRIAGGSQNRQATFGLVFEVATLKDENDRSGGELLMAPRVEPGQILEYRVKNQGVEDLWVSVVYLAADFSVDIYFSGAVRAGSALEPLRVRITDESTGTEGVVVLGVPLSVCKDEPNYQFLVQEPLGVFTKTRDVPLAAPQTPFEALLRATAFGKAGTRGSRRVTPSNPAVLSQSWITMPKTGSR